MGVELLKGQLLWVHEDDLYGEVDETRKNPGVDHGVVEKSIAQQTQGEQSNEQ